MSKHTPGPWKVSPENCLYKIDDPIKLALCEEHGFSVSFEAIGISNEKESLTLAIVPLDDSNEANARLIAAAPEMLESLKQLRDAMIRYLEGSETKLYEVTQANAAINKAEGS